MNKIGERLYNGIVKENPTLVLMLGMCPTLAVTTSAINGLGMGLTTTAVLALSNVFISLLRKVIPDRVRIPAFIVIIASFVTMTELLLKGFIPSLYSALGLYIPLIVVNCIILGRAEAYAYSNPVIPSFFDGLGMGIGFTISLTIIGSIREVLGAGEIFGYHFMPESFVPVSIFIMAPGAFFVLSILTAIQNKIKIEGEKKGKDMSRIQSGCAKDCASCGDMGCASRKFYDDSVKAEDKAEEVKTEEVKAEEAKPEEDKPEEVKPEEDKPQDDKPEEVKNEEVKIEEETAETETPEEEKPVEEKAEEDGDKNEDGEVKTDD
ncbi:MAG TPA: electron transport complex subunit RsxE [Lachnospiraceae bacterium]|nr:electron transport complex subunit RsxE [Lachnospiraceae bacterium]